VTKRIRQDGAMTLITLMAGIVKKAKQRKRKIDLGYRILNTQKNGSRRNDKKRHNPAKESDHQEPTTRRQGER